MYFSSGFFFFVIICEFANIYFHNLNSFGTNRLLHFVGKRCLFDYLYRQRIFVTSCCNGRSTHFTNFSYFWDWTVMLWHFIMWFGVMVRGRRVISTIRCDKWEEGQDSECLKNSYYIFQIDAYSNKSWTFRGINRF